MINYTITALIELTRNLPVGTNLALLHFLWMLVSGALLPQRGALFPALQATGLSSEAVRRAWAAFRGGAWQISLLLQRWQAYLQRLPGWQVHRHQGYRMITADITAFWRPTLQDCPICRKLVRQFALGDRLLPATLPRPTYRKLK